MLQTIVIYVIKVIVCSSLLFLYYHAALRNKRFHYYNRFYLLMSVVLSLALPMLKLPLLTLEIDNSKAINVLNIIYADGEAEVNSRAGTYGFGWEQYIVMLFAAISFVLLALQLFRILKIYHIKSRYPVDKTPQFDFINTDLPQAPFSFLKNVFWRKDISIQEMTGRQILQHELTHIQQKHTWDKLFMQFIVSVAWMNPFFWMIQKELYLIHEFIADEKAVENKDATAFATMLLHAHYGQSIFAPAQSFFYSPIKRRLIMLTTSEEPRLSYLRRIMALPILGCVILLFAFRLQKNEQSNAIIISTGPAFKLVVDAGHGGKDAGAIGINGIIEKDIALVISKKIKELSAEYSIDVITTRSEDILMTPPQKADFANAQNANAFVSIHVNNEEDMPGKKSGFITFISPDNNHLEESKVLGSAVMQSLATSFNAPANLTQRKAGIWVLHSVTCPAILVECGYLTNPSDVQMMTNPQQVELIARKILDGVALYANHKTKEVLDVKSAEESK